MNPASDVPVPWYALFGAFVAAAAVVGLLAPLGARYAARHRERFEESVGARMRESFLYIDAARLFAMQHLLAAAITVLVWWSSGRWQLALITALAAGAVPRWVLAALRRRRREAFRRQMADVLLLVAGGLRSGSGLGQALSQAVAEVQAPARDELGLLLREQRLGRSLDEALSSLERRMPIDETALFASALRIGAESGGSIAETLESLAGATRRKLEIEGKIRALTAQGRLQAWVMGALPFALAFVLFVLDPDSMRALVETWQGWAVCGTVLVLQAIGIASIRRIVAIDV